MLKGYPELGMTGDLKHEAAVAPLVHQLVSGEVTFMYRGIQYVSVAAGPNIICLGL